MEARASWMPSARDALCHGCPLPGITSARASVSAGSQCASGLSRTTRGCPDVKHHRIRWYKVGPTSSITLDTVASMMTTETKNLPSLDMQASSWMVTWLMGMLFCSCFRNQADSTKTCSARCPEYAAGLWHEARHAMTWV